jgi:hypothetical protein
MRLASTQETEILRKCSPFEHVLPQRYAHCPYAHNSGNILVMRVIPGYYSRARQNEPHSQTCQPTPTKSQIPHKHNNQQSSSLLPS